MVLNLEYALVSLGFLFDRFYTMVVDSNFVGLFGPVRSNSTIEDVSSPYFLHHYDTLGLILVLKPLIGDNYASWSRAMTIALLVKNKLGFIDGSISIPGGTYSLLNSWVRNNNIVISWILN